MNMFSDFDRTKIGSYRRQEKRKIGRRTKRLAMHSFAMNCRGHPGVITEKYYNDVSITSLIDGVESSCSIYHCNPDPITRGYAFWLANPFNYRLNSIDCSLKWFLEFDGYDKNYTKEDAFKGVLDLKRKILSFKPYTDRQKDAHNKVLAQIELAEKQELFTHTGFDYSGEKWRNKRSHKPSDFATPEELEKLKILQEQTYRTKNFFIDFPKEE